MSNDLGADTVCEDCDKVIAHPMAAHDCQRKSPLESRVDAIERQVRELQEDRKAVTALAAQNTQNLAVIRDLREHLAGRDAKILQLLNDINLHNQVAGRRLKLLREVLGTPDTYLPYALQDRIKAEVGGG